MPAQKAGASRATFLHALHTVVSKTRFLQLLDVAFVEYMSASSSSSSSSSSASKVCTSPTLEVDTMVRTSGERTATGTRSFHNVRILDCLLNGCSGVFNGKGVDPLAHSGLVKIEGWNGCHCELAGWKEERSWVVVIHMIHDRLTPRANRQIQELERLVFTMCTTARPSALYRVRRNSA